MLLNRLLAKFNSQFKGFSRSCCTWSEKLECMFPGMSKIEFSLYLPVKFICRHIANFQYRLITPYFLVHG